LQIGSYWSVAEQIHIAARFKPRAKRFLPFMKHVSVRSLSKVTKFDLFLYYQNFTHDIYAYTILVLLTVLTSLRFGSNF
jgi:hypothetical protein